MGFLLIPLVAPYDQFLVKVYPSNRGNDWDIEKMKIELGRELVAPAIGVDNVVPDLEGI